MLQNRSLTFDQKTTFLTGIALISMLILTTGIAYASGVVEEVSGCSVLALSRSGFVNVSNLSGLGAESDARLAAELESGKCALDEMTSEVGSGEVAAFPLALIPSSAENATEALAFESAQGLAQDAQLALELAAAQAAADVLAVTTAPGLAQDSRLALELANSKGAAEVLAFNADPGFAQDFRLAQELAFARDAVEELSGAR